MPPRRPRTLRKALACLVAAVFATGCTSDIRVTLLQDGSLGVDATVVLDTTPAGESTPSACPDLAGYAGELTATPLGPNPSDGCRISGRLPAEAGRGRYPLQWWVIDDQAYVLSPPLQNAPEAPPADEAGDWRLTVTVPGRVLSHNGTATGNTVTYASFRELTANGGPTIVSDLTPLVNRSIWVGLAGATLGFLLVGATVWLRLRRPE